MESVPELPGPLSFFKLLFLLSKKNQVTLNQVLVKVPDSLISGFGFERPVFMTMTSAGVKFAEVEAGDISEIVESMSPYTGTERGALPAFVLKKATTRLPLQNAQEAIKRWMAIQTRRGEV